MGYYRQNKNLYLCAFVKKIKLLSFCTFCLSVLSPQARVFRTNGLKHHCHACPKCVIVVVGGDSHCSA